MYSLDINFLKDREVRVFQTRPRTRPGAPADRRPLVYGLIGALVPLALVGGYWLYTRNQVNQLQARSVQLDAELAAIQSQLQEVSAIQGQIDAVRAENAAFVSVFNEIVPWSALLQDLRDRTPARVQITRLSQDAGVTPATNPEAPPPKAGGISVEGVACSFDDVNDFALVLKRSPLLESSTVSIDRAQRQSELLDPTVDGRCPGTPLDTPSFLVDYTIRANITDTPASELVDELERQGAVGLVTRLRALRETGVSGQ
ncbi:MAG TPA: PilN domain-containing protein [Leptolyngbyaceae cyanobacterium M65_K2018_010]|nr:PilN domain-containing protein [Leptolyngbyaceae cyanobacterium M65_K2018_010]